MGDHLENRALPGVKIDVIMGRQAGFLTAAAALGRQRDEIARKRRHGMGYLGLGSTITLDIDGEPVSLAWADVKEVRLVHEF